MPSTFTQNLGIEKPATGEQAGSWGTTANFSYDTIDQGIAGRLVAAMSASTYILATNQGGAPANGVNRLIRFTGAQTAPGTVQITPNTAQKIYYVQNQTTGGFPLVFTEGSGASFTLQPGYSAVISSDGLGTGAGVTGALDNPQFSNVLVTTNLTVNGAFAFTSAQTFAQPATFNGAVTLNGPATASALTINTSGYTPAPGDVYYRSASGVLAPLALGTPGQVLGVLSGPALGWTTPQGLSLGVGIGGSTPYAIYFSNAGNVLAQDSAILINPSVGIGIGVLPTHSLHLGYARQPEIVLDTNNPGGQYRQIIWATNNAPRWQLYSTVGAESGANQGSDLGLIAYNDPANSARWVFYMTRASGNVTIGPPGGDQGARLAVFGDNTGQYVVVVRAAAGMSGAIEAWQNSAGQNLAWVDTGGVLHAVGLSITGTFSIQTLSVAGNATIGGTLAVTQGIVGNLSIGGTLTVNQTLSVTSNATIGGTLSVQALSVVGSATVGGGVTVTGVTRSDQGFQVGTNKIINSVGQFTGQVATTAAILINGAQIITSRQTDPGNPFSFGDWGTNLAARTQSWCGNLWQALKNHGLF